MKRLTSFLIAAVMLISLAPASALPVSAAPTQADVTVDAYYVSLAPTLDGMTGESTWNMGNQLGESRFGMLCTQENLYIALNSKSPTAAFAIGGVTVTADLENSLVSHGAISTSNSDLAVAARTSARVDTGVVVADDGSITAEIAVPLAVLGIAFEPGYACQMHVTIGGSTLSGQLVLARRTIVLADDFDHIADKAYAARLGSEDSEIYAVQTEDGGLHYMTTTLSEAGVTLGFPNWVNLDTNGLDSSKGFQIEFHADFNDLIVRGSNAVQNGLCGACFDLRGETWQARYSFHADESGNILVSQYETGAAAVKSFDTGLDLPASDVYVRIEADDSRSATVYVNERMAGTFSPSARKPSDASRNRFYLYCGTVYRGSDERKNDLVLYDLTVTQDVPAATVPVPRLQAAGEINVDGKVEEGYWAYDLNMAEVKLGALCDMQNLYFAMKTGAAVVTLDVAGREVICRLGKSPAVSAANVSGTCRIAGSGDTYELAIPLAGLNLNQGNLDDVKLTVQAGQKTRQAVLVRGRDVTRKTLVPYDPETDDGVREATAYFASSYVILDGAVKENQWLLANRAAARMDGDAPAADIGFLWDGACLYLGADVYSDVKPRTVQMTAGAKIVTADLTTLKADCGTVAQYGQQVEWAIPLADLGLTAEVGAKTEYTVTIIGGGVSGIGGTLTLSGRTVVLGETGGDMAAKGYTEIPVAHTKWSQGERNIRLTTEPTLGTGSEIAQIYVPLDFEGGAYEFVLDTTIHNLPAFTATLGWRGMSVEIRQPQLQTRFNFRNDGTGGILMDILYLGSDYASAPTGVRLGEHAVFRIVVDEDRIPTLYVNDQFVYRYPQLNRNKFGIVDNLPMPRIILQGGNYARAKNSDGTLGVVDAEIHQILWTQTSFEDTQARLDAALDTLTDRTLLGANVADHVSSALNLPRTVTPREGMKPDYPVTWRAVDAASGTNLDCVDVNTGAIRKGAKPAAFRMVAAISSGGATASKTFSIFQIDGQGAGPVALIEHDDDPRAGQAPGQQADRYAFFDTDHNSLVYDQGSSKRFNRITLRDGDAFSRTSLNDLGVFISEDGKTFTKVTGFQLYQKGSVYTLYNLDAVARYVKVHSYQDALEGTGQGPSFYNAVSEMMTVSMESDLLGAKGEFAHSAEYKVTSATSEEDAPIHVTFADLGAKAGEYRKDAADFRFLQDGKLLAHYYDGQDGFWVRALTVPATITARWGNADAEDISDGEATFEAVYGNVTLHNFSISAPDVGQAGRAFTFPTNGDVILLSNKGGNLLLNRSTNGGRSFDPNSIVIANRTTLGRGVGIGGFLWDDELHRLYILGFAVTTAAEQGADKTAGYMAVMYTDDNGYTWSTPYYVGDASLEVMKPNDQTFKNSQGRRYFCTYTDGLKLRDADGSGPNVDYLITHGNVYRDPIIFEAAAVYSTDGGKTWTESANTVRMEIEKDSKEGGISENALYQREDGSIYLIARAQDDRNDHFYEAVSYDYGNTWQNIQPSPVISTNTHPVLRPYRGRQLLLWAGFNSLGGNARRRLPMTVGISTDEFRSYDKFIDLTFGTSFDTVLDQKNRMTQPSLFFSPDGNEAYVSYWNLRERWTEGFLVEEFGDMIFKTKGAFDDFETTSLKTEGWLRDSHDVIAVSEERALSGRRSMKISDESVSLYPSYAMRQVPSMKSGTIGASLFVPSANTDEVALELKAAYNYTFLKHSLAAITVAPDGSVFVNTDNGKTPAGKAAPDTWNDYAVSFDVKTGAASLYVNGSKTADFSLMAKGDQISAVEISDPFLSASTGTCVYVDDFYASEVTDLALTRHVTHTFDDVSADAWYKDAVDFAYTNGIMSGYSATIFGPNNTLSRAMVVQVLYNKEGKPAVTGSGLFPDVAADQWYNNAVTWGAKRGVVAGYGSGLFGPDNPVSIEQVAVILWNYSGTPSGNGSLDGVGDCSDWAANALKWAVDKGILDGVPYTSVMGSATRAQTARMLMNYLK